MAERSATRLGVAAAFAAIYLFWGGTLGVALLARGNGVWSGTLLDRLALIGSGLSWAIGSLIARDGARPSSAAQSTAMQLAAGGVAVLTLSLATGELAGWTVQQVTPRGAASLFFLVVAGTVLGFGAYTWLLRVSTPAAVGTYAFVNPLVALGLAWAVGDEPFSVRTIAAAMTVLGAVLLIKEGSNNRESSRHRLARADAHFANEGSGQVPGLGVTLSTYARFILLSSSMNRGWE